MRILIASERAGHGGGIETYLSTLAPQLKARGHEIGWLFGTSPAAGSSIADGSGGDQWVAESATASSVRNQIQSWRPHVVLANGLHDPAWDGWLTAQFPSALFAHGYFGTCISGQKCHASAKFSPCERVLGPACLTYYFPYRCGGRNPVRMIADYRRERQRQANLVNFRALIVASHHMMREYERQGLAIDRLHVVSLFPTGIVADPQPPERKPAWSNRVLMMGRLTELKGTGVACEAIAAASEQLGRRLTLVVVGDGPGARIIERDAARLSLEIEMQGWVTPDERNAQLNRADALLVPSLWPEPFGLVGIEAGAAGVPSVAFDVGGISEWLKPGVSGELAPATRPTPAKLGAALARLLSSPEHHRDLSIGAWALSHQFRLDRHVDHLESILHAVAGAA